MQDTNLDNSLLQLIIHETCWSRLHPVCLRYLSGASSPHVNRGPPGGCPRRSPGQPHPKGAPRACSTPFSAALLYCESTKRKIPRTKGRSENTRKYLGVGVLFCRLVQQALDDKDPFEQAQLYCFQLCEHVHGRLRGVSRWGSVTGVCW